MTLGIIRYNPDTGEIRNVRHEADHDYTPESDEVIAPDDADYRAIRRGERVVDLSTDPPMLVESPSDTFDRPGVVDRNTRELISEKIRAKGSDAIAARDAIASDSNIPQSVVDHADASIAMHYLIYVALTGDRIESFEERFF